MEVAKTEKGGGFRIVARRWVVERAFSWLVKCRRLRIDYEANARTSVAWVRAAVARRLAKAT